MEFLHSRLFVFGALAFILVILNACDTKSSVSRHWTESSTTEGTFESELLHRFSTLLAIPALVSASGRRRRKRKLKKRPAPGNGIGKFLRTARENGNLTQAQLAGLVKVTPAYISKLENDESIPSDDLCVDLARELKMDSQDLRIRALRLRGYEEIDALLEHRKKDRLLGLQDRERSLINIFADLNDDEQEQFLKFLQSVKSVRPAPKRSKRSSTHRRKDRE